MTIDCQFERRRSVRRSARSLLWVADDAGQHLAAPPVPGCWFAHAPIVPDRRRPGATRVLGRPDRLPA
nr:hypothetical protein [Angustibacter aerolatus]